MRLPELMERLEDISISLEMERMVDMASLTKGERVEAKKERRKLRKRRKRLEKSVEGHLSEKPKFTPPGVKVMFAFCWFLTAMAFVEAYMTFS